MLVNQFVPREIGYVNEILSKKSLRTIISKVIKKCGIPRSAQFLDDIKNLGYYMAFRGGLSFNLGDVIIPKEKEEYVNEGYQQVQEVMNNYSMGFITNNERYNQIIDIWTHVNARLADTLMKQISADQQGFNPVYMMLDSGPWIEGPDPSAFRHAWPYGQAAEERCRGRSDHREPDSGQLQGGSVGAGVLHLHPRCPKGSGRHGSEDRRRRLSDPSSG